MSTQAFKINTAERRVVTLVHGAIAGASIAATLELASQELQPRFASMALSVRTAKTRHPAGESRLENPYTWKHLEKESHE